MPSAARDRKTYVDPFTAQAALVDVNLFDSRPAELAVREPVQRRRARRRRPASTRPTVTWAVKRPLSRAAKPRRSPVASIASAQRASAPSTSSTPAHRTLACRADGNAPMPRSSSSKARHAAERRASAARQRRVSRSSVDLPEELQRDVQVLGLRDHLHLAAARRASSCAAAKIFARICLRQRHRDEAAHACSRSSLARVEVAPRQVQRVVGRRPCARDRAPPANSLVDARVVPGPQTAKQTVPDRLVGRAALRPGDAR